MPPTSVYVALPAAVNGNNRSPVAASVAAVAGKPPVLLASSLLLPPASLAALVYARLQEAHGLAVSSLKVLRCLAGHLNTADNYVWPSLPCVAYETGLSETQAGRALRALAAAGAVRVVTDVAEVAAIERRRPGRRALPGNVYDLSPLLLWVPACLVRAVVRPSVLVASPPVASLPPVASCLSMDNKEAERETGRPGVQRAETFHTPKKTPETRVLLGPSPGFLGLRAAGVSPAVAHQIIEGKGEAWALRLLAYGRSRPSPVGAGWLVRVWQGFEGWPDSFVEKVNREAARTARIARAPASATEKAPGASPAASGVSVGSIPASVAARALAAVVAGLPAGLRRVVEARGVDHRLVQAAAHRMMQQEAVNDGDVGNERPAERGGRGGGLGAAFAGAGIGRGRDPGGRSAGGVGLAGSGGGTGEAAGVSGGLDSGCSPARGDAGTGGDGRAP